MHSGGFTHIPNGTGSIPDSASAIKIICTHQLWLYRLSTTTSVSVHAKRIMRIKNKYGWLLLTVGCYLRLAVHSRLAVHLCFVLPAGPSSARTYSALPWPGVALSPFTRHMFPRAYYLALSYR